MSAGSARRISLALSIALAACTSRPQASYSDVRPDATAPPTQVEAGEVDAAPAAPAPVSPTAPTYDEVRNVLFADRNDSSSIDAACPASLAGEARIRCLYDRRFAGDAKAAGLAHELYTRFGTVAGVEEAHVMNGGYRGTIRIEPAVPAGKERKHLEWVVATMKDFDDFFQQLDRSSPTSFGRLEGAPRYRFRPITLRFMRSVEKRTPSAYAHDWTVAYNLVGTLMLSEDAVRETMFHEIFHLNDADHGHGDNWSARALGEVYDAVVKKCGASTACLAAYSPGDTLVRGGTYYAFQPGNGVGEYAAELALRYYREERAAMRGLPSKSKPFKCGPKENARAWEALKNEFFAGIDVTPACP
ncbi:hypothetical protein AKJ09_10156 [Labilithrix luteola]|uniref:Lipoprotein n=1 Tax=Labilithrix luteola TaxID=1391654 RepID=A0A0K1QCP0_9BACT|nr:hypothetical protein [Labilithrix luteola]AKV03493.1 hypothetical protein AKJ09_10156 [Labilithrix luteola]